MIRWSPEIRVGGKVEQVSSLKLVERYYSSEDEEEKRGLRRAAMQEALIRAEPKSVGLADRVVPDMIGTHGKPFTLIDYLNYSGHPGAEDLVFDLITLDRQDPSYDGQCSAVRAYLKRFNDQ